MRRCRPAFGLVELVIALTLLGVGVLALAAAAATAQRSFSSSQASERGVRAVGFVLDSLSRVSEPEDGERLDGGTLVRWSVEADSFSVELTITAEVIDGGRVHALSATAFRLRAGP